MQSEQTAKAELYMRYPLSSVAIYNSSTILHFLLGGIGIVIGYSFSSWAGYAFRSVYLVFSFAEMYVVMPIAVCPSCVYFRAKGSLCISGLNLLSRRIAEEGDLKDFPKRAKGLFCPNNLYLTSLILPILAMIPMLFLNVSVILLIIFLALLSLLLFRFFVIFPRIACLHCRAKYSCPQAEAMGVRSR